MIETKEGLLAWINQHADDDTLIHALGDVLQCDSVRYEHLESGESVFKPESWRAESNWLYKCLDWRDENCTCDHSGWSAISPYGSEPLGP
jgi:hypothetical protein